MQLSIIDIITYNWNNMDGNVNLLCKKASQRQNECVLESLKHESISLIMTIKNLYVKYETSLLVP